MERFGRYEIVAQIGAGGMGQVVRAHDTDRDRDVALKLLPEALAKDPEFQQRFRRESYAVARLRDPHVIPIHDYGEIDGRLYIDMRLVDGQSLAALLAQSGPLAPARAVSVVEQVADALDAAHAEELVHRDVKPSNILVTTAKDFVYVIDFGLAHAVGHRRTRLTMTGVTLGTLDYMAPERFENRPVDARTDVYSLACTLFECVTTSKPFPGDDFPTQMYGHLYLAPRHASEIRPEVPAALDDVIVRGMAKDPDDRYATAGEFAAAAQAAVHRSRAASGDTATGSADTVAAPRPVAVPRPAEPVEDRTQHLPMPATSVSAATTSTASPGAPFSTPTPEGPTEQVDPSRWGGSGVGVLDAPAPWTPTGGPPRQGPPSGPHGSFSAPPPSPPPPGPAPRSGFGPDGTPRGRGVRTGALLAIAVLLLAVASMGVVLLVRGGGGDTTGAAAPGGPINLDGPRKPATSVPRPTVGGTVVVGSTPGYMQVAPNGRFAYIANRAAGVITVFDTTRNQPIGTIPVPDGGPQFVAFSPDSARAYVSVFNQDYTLNEVAVIDTSSAAITARIPTGKRPFALVLSPDGRRLYVPNHDSGSITVADTGTNQVVDTVSVAPNPHWLDISPDGTRLYAANHESNVVTTIDTNGDRVLGTTPVGRSPHSIVRHPTQPLVFNVNYDDSSVSVTNIDTGAVVGTITTASHPQDITLSADGRHAYLATVDANAIQVLDTTTLSITANVPVGRGPTSVAITPDGRQAYVTNLNDGSVTVLNVAGTA
ncbi:hypothetical protein Acsp06_32330 [Actinomycetospora sp. NBRC 106375]|uniref:protein kinase domain-containing protein n=1 Tax=Actinomycetospora sp. NBRC 106375 TaxID=3032207 RepID=UPI0024A46DEE|nr:protein kinase [Actinomycetospora sp. NBRC 106375]GLZ47048.1 hypothetical protein Acsp06_32330 [Actinomycetospora sp. NBRC 106375]